MPPRYPLRFGPGTVRKPACAGGQRGASGGVMADKTMTSEPVRTDVVQAETVAGLARTAAERYGDKTALRFKRDGDWRELSFNEVSKTVDEIALGLIDLGVAPGDRVAILADTSPEWTLTSSAVWAAGGVVVPI